jgi:hypothetical protein
MGHSNRHFWSRLQRLPNRIMAWVLKVLFLANHSTRLSKAGFVLPTAVLLILMVSLTVGALSIRSFSRVEQTIAYREQQTVDSFAAPAVERAKAKLEYLFTKDQAVVDKRPPSSSDLVTAILAKAATSAADAATQTRRSEDPYTLPDETQLDLDGGTFDADPAWRFESQGQTIVYSIAMAHEKRDSSGTIVASLTDNDTVTKANNLVTRNGPINTQRPNPSCPVSRLAGDGWQDSGSELQKNFQISVLAISKSGTQNRTVSAAEYQQVRSSPKGNKYGAWFRYDLEVYPEASAPLRWNGAMHSESNIIAASPFKAYLLSSKNSCLFTPDASEITLSESPDTNGDQIPDGFQGQLVSGRPNDTFVNEQVDFHYVNTTQPLQYSVSSLATTSDSVIEDSSPTVSDIRVDPVAIFTSDTSANLRPLPNPAWSVESPATGAWPGNNDLRVRNISDAIRPYLDDGYRADNRYGPKPVYNALNSLTEDNGVAATHKIGERITSNSTLTSNNVATQEYGLDGYWERRAIGQGLRVIVGNRLELGNPYGWVGSNAATTVSAAVNNDPLYPPQSRFGDNGTDNDGRLVTSDNRIYKGPAETKQQRSLRDNLAAVQSMVVYHYTQGAAPEAGQVPYICMASTSHPGTAQSLVDSRTFSMFPETTDKRQIDFLTGKGTNGWEFDFYSDFATKIAANQPLGKALRNLAYFAGDPSGGAPSFSPVQGVENVTSGARLDVVHPYPYLSMWGDFSILRRIFTEYLDASSATTYANLSPADKSALHTAACSLGMLANNLKTYEDAAADFTGNNGMNALGVQISSLMDGNLANGEIGTKPGNYCKSGGPGGDSPGGLCAPATYDPNYYAQFTADQWINAINSDNSLGASVKAELIAKAKIIGRLRQIERDRTMGFLPAGTAIGLPGTGVGYTASAGTYVFPGSSTPFGGRTFKVGCDPTGFATTGGNSDKSQLGLSVAFCSLAEGPKYPILHYLFPKTDHNQIDSDNTTYLQPHTQEEFFTEGAASTKYIVQVNSSNAITGGINSGVTYKAVEPDDADIVLTPKTTVANFNQPTATGTGIALSTSRNDLMKNTISASGTAHELSFLDKAMLDGREMLSNRVLDLDINKLTLINNSNPKTYFTVGTNRVAWIPESSGIFYAFREDAVREDAIVRPRKISLGPNTAAGDTAAWNACKVFADLTKNTAACFMSVLPPVGTTTTTSNNQTGTFDPPLNNANLISPKAVDMYADPDRRPNGFRLFNGSQLNRTSASTAAGLTFVTDNTTYILGNFNLHQKSDGTILEEFKGTDLLGDIMATAATEAAAEAKFYGRTQLDDDFAKAGVDLWRPSEIFSDAITILSANFRDGWVEEAFTRTYGSTQGSVPVADASSYLNYHRPILTASLTGVNNLKAWRREDNKSVVADTDSNLPVRFDRNGIPYRTSVAVSGSTVTIGTAYAPHPRSYGSGSNAGNMISFYQPQSGTPAYPNFFSSSSSKSERFNNQHRAAATTRVNALLVGGIIPTRAHQSYGGFHNFPRLLEYWTDPSTAANSSALYISGGFFQLNFSTQATAPYDQDSWEPGVQPPTASNTFNISFYGAAKRIWGYDVALQYSSAAPIARRFVTVGRPRSEFYRELPLDDPYIQNLCTALKAQNGAVSCQ